MARIIASVVVGYLAFAGASMLLVSLSTAGQLPLGLAALVGLVALGAALGWLSAKIAGPGGVTATRVVAALIALATAVNFVFALGVEPTWHKLASLFLTAPLVALVGQKVSIGGQAS